MIKFISLAKRRPGTTMEEFVKYNEERHAKLGTDNMKGKAAKYLRRYLYAIPHLVEFAQDPASDDFPVRLPAIPTGGVGEADFDEITEIWFENVEQWKANMAQLRNPSAVQAIEADEGNFMDRSRLRHYIVVDVESSVSD